MKEYDDHDNANFTRLREFLHYMEEAKAVNGYYPHESVDDMVEMLGTCHGYIEALNAEASKIVNEDLEQVQGNYGPPIYRILSGSRIKNLLFHLARRKS